LKYFLLFTFLSGCYVLLHKYYLEPMANLKHDEMIIKNEKRVYNNNIIKIKKFENNITSKKQQAIEKIKKIEKTEVKDINENTDFSDGCHNLIL